MMDSENSRFIYAYDDEERQIIGINSNTQKPKPQQNRILSLLYYLKRERRYDDLRRFTLWCARRSNACIKPQQKKFIELGDWAVRGKTSIEDLRQHYDRSAGQAIATDTVELAQGSSRAAGFLASRECVNPDAFEGAGKAAHYHYLWAKMNEAKNDSSGFMEEAGTAASKEVARQTEQEQVDCLLDLIGAYLT